MFQTTTSYKSTTIMPAPSLAHLNPYDTISTPVMTQNSFFSNSWMVQLFHESFIGENWIQRLIVPESLQKPLYGREDLNFWLQELASFSPPIELVWSITEKLPSLSLLLSEERDND